MMEDWVECKFGTLLDVQGGSQPPKKEFIFEPKEGYIRLLQIRDFGEKPIPTYIPIDKARKTCTKEDIFIARYGASLGRIVTGMEGAYNVALAKVIDKYSLFSNKYLFFLLQTQIFQEPIHMISRSAQNGFAKSDIYPIKIPLPPLPIQRAIVARIEELFSSLDGGVADLQRAQEQLQVYRQAVLKKAFEGELTREWREQQTDLPSAEELLEQIQEERQRYYEQQLVEWEATGRIGKQPKNKKLKGGTSQYSSSYPNLPKQWSIVSPEWLASPENYSIGIGPFGSNLKVSDYTESGVPLIFVRNITRNDYTLRQKFISERKYEELIPHSVKPLDILVTKMGDPPGDVSIYPPNAPKAVITSDCLKFRVWPQFANRRFFKYCIESVFIKKQLGLITQGVAQKKISAGRFKTLDFPFCNLEEQQKVVQEIESRLSVCDQVEANIQESLAKAEALRQSILKKAFEGDLLTAAEIAACKQEADYEPATVLLARMKSRKKG